MKIRKAILTGGGRATRLYPITTTLNKHLIPLANKPMIFHAIEKVVAAGITEIFINTNPGETELQKYVGDGGHWGVSITFFEQIGGPQGIAHTVQEAKKFIGNEPFIFFLSDNILLGGLTEIITEFETEKYDCMLALASVPDPERFGVPFFDENKKLIDVVEKPAKAPSPFAVTGIYLYGPKVFFEAFPQIEKSPRGEYEISSIHSHLLKHQFRVGYREITGWWKDTGKPDDLLQANQLLLDNMPTDEFILESKVALDSSVSGRVRIGAGVRIGANVSLIGPVIIGENCILENCTIGPYVSLSSGSEVKGTQIHDSLILSNSIICGAMKINHSLIGKQASIIKHSIEYANRGGQRLIVGDKTVIEW